MEILVRHYLRIEPDQDLDKLTEQYGAALWIEERQRDLLASAVNKGFAGKN